MESKPIASPNWERQKPDLRDALHAIAECAAGPFGISLQRAVGDHLQVFRTAIRDGASHRALALLLHEAGVAGRDGEAPAVGSISRALNRAIAKCGADAAAVPSQSRLTRRRVDAVPSAAENSDAAGSHKVNPEIRAPIEPGAARLPIPPPADIPGADTLMASALRRGRLLNELKALRHDHQPNDEGSSILRSADPPTTDTLRRGRILNN